MEQLNAQFIGKGDLAFDIGAHVGDRTASFSRLGASVVALEPQPRVFRALRLIHGRTPRIALRPEAVGASPSQIDLFVNTANPTISTASRGLMDAAAGAEGWQGQVWDAPVRVPVTTLDQLIDEHGMPDFTKIDVEGHEAEVLAGLSRALPALSFEFTTIQRDLVGVCLDRLAVLGAYEFNLSLGEDHTLRHTAWVSRARIAADIEALPFDANSGDVYARVLA